VILKQNRFSMPSQIKSTRVIARSASRFCQNGSNFQPHGGYTARAGEMFRLTESDKTRKLRQTSRSSFIRTKDSWINEEAQNNERADLRRIKFAIASIPFGAKTSFPA